MIHLFDKMETFMAFSALLTLVIAGMADNHVGPRPPDLVCPAGEYVSCYDEQNIMCPTAICLACPQRTFNLKKDQSSKCADCTECFGSRVLTSAPCNSTSNAVCDCRFGYYASRLPLPDGGGLLCARNSSCHSGILERRSPESPVTCEEQPIVAKTSMPTRKLPVETMTTSEPLVLTVDPLVKLEVVPESSPSTAPAIVNATKPPRQPDRDKAMISSESVKWIAIPLVIVCVVLIFAFLCHKYMKYKDRRDMRKTFLDKEKAVLVKNDSYPNEAFPGIVDPSLQNGGIIGDVRNGLSFTDRAAIVNGIPQGLDLAHNYTNNPRPTHNGIPPGLDLAHNYTNNLGPTHNGIPTGLDLAHNYTNNLGPTHNGIPAGPPLILFNPNNPGTTHPRPPTAFNGNRKNITSEQTLVKHRMDSVSQLDECSSTDREGSQVDSHLSDGTFWMDSVTQLDKCPTTDREVLKAECQDSEGTFWMDSGSKQIPAQTSLDPMSLVSDDRTAAEHKMGQTLLKRRMDSGLSLEATDRSSGFNYSLPTAELTSSEGSKSPSLPTHPVSNGPNPEPRSAPSARPRTSYKPNTKQAQSVQNNFHFGKGVTINLYNNSPSNSKSGNCHSLDKEQNHPMNKLFSWMLQNLEPSVLLLGILRENMVISEETHQKIRGAITTNEKITILIEHIIRSGDQGLEVLKNALDTVNQSHVADKIRQEEHFGKEGDAKN